MPFSRPQVGRANPISPCEDVHKQHKQLPGSAEGLLCSSQPCFVLRDEAKWPQFIWLPLDSLLWHVFSVAVLCQAPGALDGTYHFCCFPSFEEGGSFWKVPSFSHCTNPVLQDLTVRDQGRELFTSAMSLGRPEPAVSKGQHMVRGTWAAEQW